MTNEKIKQDNLEREANWIYQRNNLIKNQLHNLTNILNATLRDFEKMQEQLQYLQDKSKDV
tara:strand:+ start:308 stop:490 length:183 start_codon:yes stop_codon:yes gene_type:complete